ncbi:polyhomeotic protein 1 like [Trichuris trichiura]|uniref:Polyhomeotic protein 1 like n=1 Tax=Trichuris trichiura TaxID=36087 RepID=A0A077ZDT5_TRITR|nr:polyhomeotic protein 1 like [Trichuris trichiura]
MSNDNRAGMSNFSCVAINKDEYGSSEKNETNYQYDSEPDALRIVSREGSPVPLSCTTETRFSNVRHVTPPPSLDGPEVLQPAVNRVPRTAVPPAVEAAVPQGRNAALNQSSVVSPVPIAPVPIQPAPTAGTTKQSVPATAFPLRSLSATSAHTVSTPSALNSLLGTLEKQGQRTFSSGQSNINNGFGRVPNQVSSQIDPQRMQRQTVLLGQNARALGYFPQKNLANSLHGHTRTTSASRSNQVRHTIGNMGLPQRYPPVSSMNAARSVHPQQFGFDGNRKSYAMLSNAVHPMVSTSGVAQLPVVFPSPMIVKISDSPLLNLQVPSTSHVVAAVNQPVDTAVGFSPGCSVAVASVRPSNIGNCGRVQPKSISIPKRPPAQCSNSIGLIVSAATAQAEELNHKLPKPQYSGSSAERQLRPLMPKERTPASTKSPRYVYAYALGETNGQNARFSNGAVPYLNNHANALQCVPVNNVADISRQATQKENEVYKSMVTEFNRNKPDEVKISSNVVDDVLIQETLDPTPMEMAHHYPYQDYKCDALFKSCTGTLSELYIGSTSERKAENSAFISKRACEGSAESLSDVAPTLGRGSHTDVGSSVNKSAAPFHLSTPSSRVLKQEDVKLWTPEEVVQWLHVTDPTFDMYHQLFLDNSIDGPAFILLREEHLLNRMQIRLGHAVKMMAAIDRLRETVSQNQIPA